MKYFLRNLRWILIGGPAQEEKDHARHPRGRIQGGYQPKHPPLGPPPRPNRQVVATKPQGVPYRFEARGNKSHQPAPVALGFGMLDTSWMDREEPNNTKELNLAPAYRPLNDQVRLVEAMKNIQRTQAIGSDYWTYLDKEIQKEEARLSRIESDVSGKPQSLLDRVQEKVAADLHRELEEKNQVIANMREELNRRAEEASWPIVTSVGRQGKRRTYRIPPPGPPNPIVTGPTLPRLPRRRNRNQYRGAGDGLDMSIPLGPPPLTNRERLALKRLQEKTEELKRGG